ncbi:MAG: hypothetical protein ACLPY5_03200 [Candidatus Bathyarchaeia archaeon]
MLPVGFIRARKQSPVKILLVTQRFHLCANSGFRARNPNKKISFFPNVVKNEVKFEIIGTGHKAIPRNFNPDKGTISRAIVTCLVCGSVVEGDVIRSLFVHGKLLSKQTVVSRQIVTHGR